MTFCNTVLFTFCLTVFLNTEVKAATCTTWQKGDVKDAEGTDGIIHNIFNHNYYVQLKLDKSMLATNEEPTIDLKPTVYTDISDEFNSINKSRSGLGDDDDDDTRLRKKGTKHKIVKYQLPVKVENDTAKEDGKFMYFQVGETRDTQAPRKTQRLDEENDAGTYDEDYQNKYISQGIGRGNYEGMNTADMDDSEHDVNGTDEVEIKDTVRASDKGTVRYDDDITSAHFDELGHSGGANLNGHNNSYGKHNIKTDPRNYVDVTNNDFDDDDYGYQFDYNNHGGSTVARKPNIKGNARKDPVSKHNTFGDAYGYRVDDNNHGGSTVPRRPNVKNNARKDHVRAPDAFGDDNVHQVDENIHEDSTTDNNGLPNVKEIVKHIEDGNDLNIKYGKNTILVECTNEDYPDISCIETVQGRDKESRGSARGVNRYVDEMVENVDNRGGDKIGPKRTPYGTDRVGGEWRTRSGKGVALVQDENNNAKPHDIRQEMIRERVKHRGLQANVGRNVGEDGVDEHVTPYYETANAGVDDTNVNRRGKAKAVSMRNGGAGFRGEVVDDGNEYADDKLVPETDIETDVILKGGDACGHREKGALNGVNTGQYVGYPTINGAHEDTYYEHENEERGLITNVHSNKVDDRHTDVTLGRVGKLQPHDDQWSDHDEGTLSVGISDPQHYISSLGGSYRPNNKQNIPTGQVKLSHPDIVDTGSYSCLGNDNIPPTPHSLPLHLSDVVRENEGVSYGQGYYDDGENTHPVHYEGKPKYVNNDQVSLRSLNLPNEHQLAGAVLEDENNYEAALPDTNMDTLKVTMWPCLAVKNRVVPFNRPLAYHATMVN